MSRTQAEDLILLGLNKLGAIVDTDELIEDMAGPNSPLNEISEDEFVKLFNHLVELGFIRLDPLSNDPKRYFRITRRAYERLRLPGSDADVQRSNELRALASSELGIAHITRNEQFAKMSFGLEQIANAINRFAKAAEGRNEVIRENTRAIDRNSMEARQNTRDLIGAMLGSKRHVAGEDGEDGETIQPPEGGSDA